MVNHTTVSITTCLLQKFNRVRWSDNLMVSIVYSCLHTAFWAAPKAIADSVPHGVSYVLTLRQHQSAANNVTLSVSFKTFVCTFLVTQRPQPALADKCDKGSVGKE
jgi:hypothetical protein